VKVFIADSGNPGTSALTYRIAAALGGCPVLFETKRQRHFRALGRRRGGVRTAEKAGSAIVFPRYEASEASTQADES